jgi:hypothetical protein
MNKEAMKQSNLDPSQFMLRVIDQGFVFEEHLIFSLGSNLLKLEIGMLP